MEEKVTVKCTKCGGKLSRGDGWSKTREVVVYGLCSSCRQDFGDQSYLDDGSFTHVDEGLDRPRETERDYDDDWESELQRDGVYE